MRLIICMAFCGYLLLFPARAADAARAAMALWARSVAPALFPFMALMPVLAGEEARGLYGRLFGRRMKKGFHLPGSAASPIAVGWIAGTPAGASAVRRAFDAGALSDRQALTAGILASGLSPVFLVCSVGGGMFLRPAVGARILICADAALLGTGALFSRLPLRGALLMKNGIPRAEGKGVSVSGAVKAILGVCGWMALFGAASSALPQGIRWIFEVSAGCDFAAKTQKPILAAFVCGMGGACGLCQNVSALGTTGTGTLALVLGKLACGALSAGLYAAADFALQGRALPFMTAAFKDSFWVSAMAAFALALGICAFAGIGTRRTGQRARKGQDIDETS